MALYTSNSLNAIFHIRTGGQGEPGTVTVIYWPPKEDTAGHILNGSLGKIARDLLPPIMGRPAFEAAVAFQKRLKEDEWRQRKFGHTWLDQPSSANNMSNRQALEAIIRKLEEHQAETNQRALITQRDALQRALAEVEAELATRSYQRQLL